MCIENAICIYSIRRIHTFISICTVVLKNRLLPNFNEGDNKTNFIFGEQNLKVFKIISRKEGWMKRKRRLWSVLCNGKRNIKTICPFCIQLRWVCPQIYYMANSRSKVYNPTERIALQIFCVCNEYEMTSTICLHKYEHMQGFTKDFGFC